MNHMELVLAPYPEKCAYYLPHHVAMKESSITLQPNRGSFLTDPPHLALDYPLMIFYTDVPRFSHTIKYFIEIQNAFYSYHS